MDGRCGRGGLQEHQRLGRSVRAPARQRGDFCLICLPCSEEDRETAADLAYAIQHAIRYSERPNRFLYGTDWPLAPMLPYRDFMLAAVPPEYHESVFEENARVLFRV